MGVVETLRQYDVFPKPLDDFRIRTASGAAVSVASLALVVYLFMSEFFMYMSPTLHTELVVDSSREKQNVNIFFDVTFPHIGCSMLSLDAVDVSKQHKANVNEHVVKTRIMPDGTRTDSHNVKLGTAVTHEDQLRAGAGSTEGQAQTGSGSDECCNTCDEVKEAYRRKGWAFDPSTEIEQCKAEIVAVLEQEKGQGCRVHGYVQVKRVAGQFIIAPSSALQHASEQVEDVVGFTLQRFNATHTIEQLQFTEASVVHPPSRAAKQPLEGTHHAMDLPGMFQYFLQVIPTEQRHKSSHANAYVYAASTHFRQITPGNTHGSLPGVYINYDLSPIMMVESLQTQPLGHFLTAVCAIVGGVFTVMGIVDKAVYVAVERWQKLSKSSLLGKQ